MKTKLTVEELLKALADYNEKNSTPTHRFECSIQLYAGGTGRLVHVGEAFEDIEECLKLLGAK